MTAIHFILVACLLGCQTQYTGQSKTLTSGLSEISVSPMGKIPGTLSLENATKIAKPGTIINLFPGEYSSNFTISSSGEFEKPIIFRGQGKSTIIRTKKEVTTTSREAHLNWLLHDVQDPQLSDSCVLIKNAKWIVFENLAFENCWYSAVRIKNGQYITLRNVDVIGGSYVVFATDIGTKHLLIEESHWIQDPTNKIWSEIPWEESHHGKHMFYNGGFLMSVDIAGDIIIRRNKIENAFNGIILNRFNAEARSVNRNIEIYENEFRYIRDNPIEPEDHAYNFWAHHNKFRQTHATFSIEKLAGGEWYFFGNVGIQTEKPFGNHSSGKVFKLSRIDDEEESPLPDAPVHIFNNSWFARETYFEPEALPRIINHYNNVVIFSGSPTETTFAPANWHDSVTFDYDYSNHAFSSSLQDEHQETHGVVSTLTGFVNPKDGDFRLTEKSKAIDAGKELEFNGTTVPYLGSRPDIGAFEGRRPISGPMFTIPETDRNGIHPRVIDARIKKDSVVLFFSIPLKHQATKVLLTNEVGTKYSSQDCAIAQAKMECPLPPKLYGTRPTKIAIPTLLGENGLELTLWGKNPNFIERRQTHLN